MLENKLYALIFDNEITLYWNRVKTLGEDECFSVFLNGEKAGTTKKTHFEFFNLSPETTYDIKVSLTGEGNEAFSLTGVFTTKAAPKRIDVTKPPYNAVGDGKTLNREAIQKALDDCEKGECVYFPAGVYLTGGLIVHSDTEIYIEKGAILQGTADYRDYLPKVKSRFEGIERLCYQSILNLGSLDHTAGYNCENVVIHGGGSIISAGEELATSIINNEVPALKGTPEVEEYLATLDEASKKIPVLATIVEGRARGRLIQMANCQNIVIADLYLANSPSWNVHFIYSKNIVTTRCKIFSNDVHNGDGWNPDSSEDCTIFNSQFETGDDCIAIKSGKNPEGNIINRPTRNINVFDCVSFCGHALAIGSEMSGGVEDVTIWDSDFEKVEYGLHIKSTLKRGGYIKNMRMYNTVIPRIFMNLAYGCNDDGQTSGTYPKLSDFHYEDLTITGRGFVPDENGGYISYMDGIHLRGSDDNNFYFENITIKNCKVLAHPAPSVQSIIYKNIKNLTIENLMVE